MGHDGRAIEAAETNTKTEPMVRTTRRYGKILAVPCNTVTFPQKYIRSQNDRHGCLGFGEDRRERAGEDERRPDERGTYLQQEREHMNQAVNFIFRK